MPWESSSRARGTAGAVLGTILLESFDPDILSLSLAGMIGLYILVYFLHPSLRLTPATTRLTSPPGLFVLSLLSLVPIMAFLPLGSRLTDRLSQDLRVRDLVMLLGSGLKLVYDGLT